MYSMGMHTHAMPECSKTIFHFLFILLLLLMGKRSVYLDSSHGLPFLQGIFRFSCVAAAAAATAAVVDCDDDGVIMAL